MDRVHSPGPPGALQRPALVLNQGWTPVHVTSAHRALCMLYRGTALVVATEDLATHDFQSWLACEATHYVRTAQSRIPVPEVILVRRYTRVPSHHAPFSRRNLFQRDGHECQYCGRQCRSDEASIDHITPRSLGGPTTWENCVLACLRCNARKANKTPRQAGLRLRREPRRPRWTPYLTIARSEPLPSWHQFSPELRRAAGS